MSVINHLKRLLNSIQSLRISPFSHIPIFSPFSHHPILSLSLFLIISSSHLPIISDAWSATYYVDATNGSDINTRLSLINSLENDRQSQRRENLTQESGGKQIEPCPFPFRRRLSPPSSWQKAFPGTTATPRMGIPT